MADAPFITVPASIEHRTDPRLMPVRCTPCGWTGRASQLNFLDDVIVTPGEVVPAGHCPRCGNLAYPDSPSSGDDSGKPAERSEMA